MKLVLASGKRKTAIARARIKSGSGVIRVNSVLLDTIPREFVKEKIFETLSVIGDEHLAKIDIDVTVDGGGYMSQAEAIRTAIARGVVKWFHPKKTKIRSTIVDYQRTMIVGEPRRKESKKSGKRGARAKRQKSYR